MAVSEIFWRKMAAPQFLWRKMAVPKILWRKMTDTLDFLTQHGGLAAILRHKITNTAMLRQKILGSDATWRVSRILWRKMADTSD